MPSKIINLFSGKFLSIDDVIKQLSAFESICMADDDLRGVFATAYLHITKSIQTELAGNAFRDKEWVESYLIRFGNLYREALVYYENGQTELIPKSWKFSFDLAAQKEGLIIQHLLLGINAHINHDLAIALFDVKIDPDRVDKYADHTKINEILEQATDTLKKEVSVKYAPILKRLDRKTGYVSDEVTNFSIPKARENAWSFAIALTRAANQTEQQILRKALDDQAAVLARLILASPTQNPRFTRTVSVLKWLDSLANRIQNIFRRS